MNRSTNLSLLLALAFAAILAGCQVKPTVPDYDGAMLYQGYCASCHGPIGKGDGPVAPSMMVKMQDLRTIQARNNGVFPHDMIKDMIDGSGMRATHGSHDMPVWGWTFYSAEYKMGEEEPDKFAAARISGLVKYLESIQITD